MKMSGAITVRIDATEAKEIELLKQKGITQADCFRRGKELYLKEIIQSSTEK
jgi:hypothetical protein